MATEEDLLRAAELVSSMAGGPEPEPGDYACLLDESNPRGAVCICRANGELVVLMLREAWDQLEAMTSQKSKSGRRVKKDLTSKGKPK